LPFVSSPVSAARGFIESFLCPFVIRYCLVGSGWRGGSVGRDGGGDGGLALQLPFMQVSESMGNHDSKIVDAASVD
jgi:hypothetical protein